MSDDSGAKIPVFDGNAKNYTMWWVRFSAYAVMKNFSRALKLDKSLPASDEVEPETDEAKLAKKANEVAMASLTMAFRTDAMLNVIFRSMNKDWPGGLAYKVIEELKRQFQPEDIMCRVELRRSLNKIKMQKGSDPAKLFEQIYSIQNRSKIEIPEDDFVAVVLDAASEEYQAVLTNEQTRHGADLKVKHLEDVMRNHYRNISKKTGGGDDENKEITLSGVGSGFGGICFHCKKKGHRIKDCPDKKSSNSNDDNKNNNNKGGKFTGKCNNCGKIGHKSENCWEKDENASKRPKNWKRKEVTAAGIDNDDAVEYLLCGLSNEKVVKVKAPKGFPDSPELLKDPNIWIADSATTMHNTKHKAGMVDVRTETHGIVMGNGEEVKTQEMGNIKVTVCDNQGNQDFDVTLTDVAVNPKGPFNLFSTSKLQRLGWKLGGDENALWLSKDSKIIKFDIVVTTEKGLVFCACLKRKTQEMANVGTDSVALTVNQAHG